MITKKNVAFSDFQHRFRSSRSTKDPLTVVSGRIAGVCNRSRLIYPRFLRELCMLVFFTNLNLMEF